MRGLLLLMGWIFLGPCASVRAQDPAAPTDGALLDLLEALVDGPSTARRAKADELAARSDIELSRWLDATRSFGRFRAAPVGLAREDAVLDNRTKTRLTTFVPTSYDPKTPCPLVMAFHGAGGDGRWLVAAWKELAEKHGCLVVGPYEPLANNGYTASPAERDGAWAALRWARRKFNVDEDRIYAVGYSRGAHLVWDLALRRPDRFAAMAGIVGGPRITLANGQNNLRYVENVAHLPVVSVQGAKDDPILLHNVRMAFKRLKKFDAPHAQLIVQEDKGHDADWTKVDWGAWLAARRDPNRKRVVRTAVHDTYARAAWVEALDVSKKAAVQFAIRVPASRASSLTPEKMRELFQKEADKRTARLVARMHGPGRFSLRATMVGKARLLLPDAMLGDKSTLQVNWRGRQLRKPFERSKQVLLRDFAERFDRSFLPTVEVRVP